MTESSEAREIENETRAVLEAIKVGLPKWPALIVSGKPVAPEQATEILFRTTDGWWSTNDREFLYEVALVMGADVVSVEGEYGPYLKFEPVWTSRYGHLDLMYLSNSRICTSYIFGPKGWCDWDGTIFANSFNIGKWPSVQSVLEDWAAIARAFPFLELHCQLLNREAGYAERSEFDDNPEPVRVLVEFFVKNGEVTARAADPDTAIIVPDCPPFNERFDAMGSRLTDSSKEHISVRMFAEKWAEFKRIMDERAG